MRQTAQELVIENQAGDCGNWDRSMGCSWRWNHMISTRARTWNWGVSRMCPWRSSGPAWRYQYGLECGGVNLCRSYQRRTIIAAEAFTAEFPERWLQHPASMKSQGDWAFCAGINRFVFHRFQSQSGTDDLPGMTMGPDGGYGVHWDRTQTWWDMAHAYHQYVTRCSSMLRRGRFVADVFTSQPRERPTCFCRRLRRFYRADFPIVAATISTGAVREL